MILRKCAPDKEKQIRAIFEKQPFGELERLVTQKLLDVVKRVAKEELESETWLHLVARLSGRSYEQMRVTILEFLDTDVFSVSVENCVSFLDPLIESWDIDLATFAMEIVLNRRLAPGHPKKFEFVEREPDQPDEEPGVKEFLRDPSLSGDTTEEEIEFLKKLRFNGKRPKGQSPRCTNIWRLMALRNNCSLTAGKGQYSAGQGTKAAGAKNKEQSRRRLLPKLFPRT